MRERKRSLLNKVKKYVAKAAYFFAKEIFFCGNVPMPVLPSRTNVRFVHISMTYILDIFLK